MKVYRHYLRITYNLLSDIVSKSSTLGVSEKNSKAARKSVKYPILGTVLNYIFYHSLSTSKGVKQN